MEKPEIKIDWSDFDSIGNSTQIIRHRYFTRALGGLIASTIPMQHMQKVLDVGCGIGGWVIDMVKQYPWVHITGIDIDEPALRDARLQGHWSGSRTLSFQHMDATKHLAFADGDFDLIHMRSATFLHGRLWSTTLAELVRLLRPGGWLNLVEYEPGQTSSEALNRLMSLQIEVSQIYRRSSVSPSHCSIRPAAHLYHLLLDIAMLDVSYSVHIVDFGSGNSLDSREYIEDLLTTALTLKPLICRLELINPRAYDKLLQAARNEMAQPWASGYAYLVSATGCKNG